MFLVLDSRTLNTSPSFKRGLWRKKKLKTATRNESGTLTSGLCITCHGHFMKGNLAACINIENLLYFLIQLGIYTIEIHMCKKNPSVFKGVLRNISSNTIKVDKQTKEHPYHEIIFSNSQE